MYVLVCLMHIYSTGPGSAFIPRIKWHRCHVCKIVHRFEERKFGMYMKTDLKTEHLRVNVDKEKRWYKTEE